MTMLKKLNLNSLSLMIALTVPSMMAVGCGSSTMVRFADYEVAANASGHGGMLIAKSKKHEAAPMLPSQIGKAITALYNLLTPQARADVSTLKMCFKEIRIKREEGNNKDGDKNQSLDVGLVSMDETGTELTDVELEAGDYKLVEFDLKDECDTGYSVSFTNGTGAYETDDHIQIRFEGTFDPAEDGDVIDLGIQDMVTAMNAITDANDIKDDLEEISGTF